MRWKLGIMVWSAGMLGVCAMTFIVLPRLMALLPEMIGGETPELPPLSVLVLASLFQSSVLVGLATWAGVAMSPAAGLRAPAFEAAATRSSIGPALRAQLLPGLIAGGIGGVALALFSRMAPLAVQEAQGRIAMPLVVRMLYGGITEEVLLRWGFLTLLVWLAFRFASRRPAWVWAAIFLSSIVFAAGHLPAAGILIGLTPEVVGYVLIVNTTFGVAFGWLYWRYGLEAAILAHAGAHIVSWAVGS